MHTIVDHSTVSSHRIVSILILLEKDFSDFLTFLSFIMAKSERQNNKTEHAVQSQGCAYAAVLSNH